MGVLDRGGVDGLATLVEVKEGDLTVVLPAREPVLVLGVVVDAAQLRGRLERLARGGGVREVPDVRFDGHALRLLLELERGVGDGDAGAGVVEG